MRNLSIILLLFTFVTISHASNVQEEFQQNTLQVLSVVEESDSKTFTVLINEPSWAEVGSNQELRVAEFPGEGFNDITGQPVIPVIGRMVRIPVSGGAHIEILDTHFRIMSDINYAAYYGEGLESELEGSDPTIDRWYPEEIVSIDSPSIFKDFRVANISTYPIQVNPARREVRVYDRLEYRVVYDQSTDENSLASWPTSLSETFLPFYREMLDWTESELDQYDIYRGAVQLVCKTTWSSILTDWVTWKRQKGWDIQLITEQDASWTRTGIKSELQSRYDASDIKFDHIVLIGDASGSITTPPGSSGDFHGAGDHYYGLLAGDDQLLEAAVGRISVSTTTELSAYIRKVLSYEKTTNLDNTSWYNRGSVAAGSAASGVSTIYVARYARDRMLESGYTSVDTAFYNDGMGSVNQRTINFLNNGVSFHLYRGFLGSGLSNADILGLNNTEMLPVVVDITCGRGDWADGTSINEAYMRAGTVNYARGGIGAVSTATSSTHTRFNNALAGGAVEAVFVKKTPTLGQMMLGAKFNLWKNFNGFQNDGVENFNQWLNLMGDPTVWIYTDVPNPTITVDVENQIELGSNGIEVWVEDSMGALQGAWVTFFKSEDEGEVISRGVTDENGYAFLDVHCSEIGNGTLTVTAYNYRPVQMQIEVFAPDNLIGLVGHTILDNGTSGTIGNGNGIPEAGETVGLLFTLMNYGLSTQTGITLSANSTDSNIISVSGTPALASLDAGEDSELLDPVLVEINVDAPDDWTSVLNTSIESASSNFTDKYGITINAPNLIYVGSSGEILPDQQGTVSFTLANIGGADIGNTTLTLQVNDINGEWITIDNANGTLDPVAIGATAVSSNFTLTGSPDAYKGYSVTGRLTVENSANRIQYVPVKIQLGTKSQTDPEGPDGYGYFAYDDVDAAYIMRPSYEWIEIDPDEPDAMYNGAELPLTDTGEDQDVSMALDLPFEFTYYGVSYNTITICSNGWIAMGNQEGIALQRNWVIPSPLGPSAMIAPFWDDRLNSTEENGIFYYYAEDEGKCIIEWHNLEDAASRNHCTFQVILLEYEEDFPTPTGDNEFIFNYKEVNPSTGNHSDVPYWTTGIENASQTDGLQLSYYNVPSSGTAPITDGRSIMISTRTSFETGIVTGIVTLLEDETPVNGVIVSSSSMGNTDTTDVEGRYSIFAASGTTDISFVKNGYVTVIVEDVVVPSEGSVTVNAQMARPVFSVDPDTLTFVIEPEDTQIQSFSMENSGDAVLSYEVDVVGLDPTGSGNGIGSVYDDVQLPQLSDRLCYDCDSRNDTLWVLTRDYDDFNSIVRLYDLEGNQLDFYRMPFTTSLSRIQVHENIMICASLNELRFYTISDHLTLDSTKTLPVPLYNYDFRVDYENERIYIVTTSYFNEYDFDFQNLNTHVFHDYLFYGIDNIPDDPDGFTLHMLVLQWIQGEVTYKVIRYNPTTEREETVFENIEGIDAWPGGLTLLGMNHDMNYLAGIIYPGTSNVVLHNYVSFLDWLSLDHYSGEIQPESSQSVNVAVSSEGFPAGTYNAWLSITHNAIGGYSTVPVILNVGSVNVNEEKHLPMDWTLDKVYPNPFNPVATVKFSLLENVTVNARLYNILGQQVAELVNRPMMAGQHTLTINGENLSSGVYFLKFNAGPLSSVQKVVLLK